MPCFVTKMWENILTLWIVHINPWDRLISCSYSESNVAVIKSFTKGFVFIWVQSTKYCRQLVTNYQPIIGNINWLLGESYEMHLSVGRPKREIWSIERNRKKFVSEDRTNFNSLPSNGTTHTASLFFRAWA